MDVGPLFARRWPAPTVAMRSRFLSLSTILLVFAIVATAIVGFAHVSLQQQSLILLREESQEIRAVHQALTQADTDVMYFALGESGRLESYFANVAMLGHAGATLGHLDTILSAQGQPSALALIATLKGVWAKSIAQAAAGDRTAAQAILADNRTGETVARIGNAVEALVQRADKQFPLHENRIQIGTLLVLLLQVGGGILAILGLYYAFRWSNAEAHARATAVASADASREQVIRLFDMADVLQSAADHIDANAVLKATAVKLVPGFPGALYVFNNSRDRLVLSSSWGNADGQKLPETINPNSCWAVKRGKPHTNHTEPDRLCCEHHSSSAAILEIPMIARGEIVGLLQIFAEGADAEERLETVTALAAALADGMSLALANMALREKLRNQALRDPLTGLYNRRYMEDTLQRMVRLAERENREISVLMLDLDHFKRLNDERGHAFGDQVLKDTAVALIGSLRETDVVCRYGGEEIVVILPDCPIERAVDKAEQLRLRIEELSNAHGAPISASFGVSSVPHTSQSVSDVLAAADSALYKAKQNGRNQVTTAPLRAFRLDRTDEQTTRVGTEDATPVPDLVEDLSLEVIDEVPRQAAE
jgi:diguanylate cyclase (GGDEF)-like protein